MPKEIKQLPDVPKDTSKGAWEFFQLVKYNMLRLEENRQDVQSALDTKIDADLEDWVAPTLLNSWVDYSASFTPAGYMKDNQGFVHLRGHIKDGTPGAGSIAFVLPEGYRPSKTMWFIVPANSGAGYLYGRVEINSSGEVIIRNEGSGWLSFHGIYFLPEL